MNKQKKSKRGRRTSRTSCWSRHYSGDLSRKFWKKISALKPRKIWYQAYSLGVKLQNIENVTLKFIEANAAVPVAKHTDDGVVGGKG